MVTFRSIKYAEVIAAAFALLSLTSCLTEVNQDNPYDPTLPAHWRQTDSAESDDTATTAAAEETEASAESTDEAESTTAAVSETETAQLKGNFYDINGKLLMHSVPDEYGVERRYAPEQYKVAFANILSSMSCGFDDTFSETLRVKNPTPVGGDDITGRSVQLTIDADIQNAVYQYMQSTNLVGSVVVMRTDGSIMSEVSYPSYDPDLYIADPSYAESLPWGAFGNKAFQNAAPGSCFKIMSEVISDKHGINVLPDDGIWSDSGTTILNWDYDTNYNYPITERTLSSAFVGSSNVFFAKAFNEIGTADVLKDLNDIFHFGTEADIYCDFGPLENTITINCSDDLRRSAFGQSYVQTCPIYLAALGREAVFGDMVKPFVVKNIVDTNNCSEIIESGSRSYEIIGTIPEKYRQNLLDGMQAVASNLGIPVHENYTLYAKTGTASVGAGEFLYITGILANKNDRTSEKTVYKDYSDYKSDGSYIIVMQIQNPYDHGLDYASEAAWFYKGLIDIILS